MTLPRASALRGLERGAGGGRLSPPFSHTLSPRLSRFYSVHYSNHVAFLPADEPPPGSPRRAGGQDSPAAAAPEGGGGVWRQPSADKDRRPALDESFGRQDQGQISLPCWATAEGLQGPLSVIPSAGGQSDGSFFLYIFS